MAEIVVYHGQQAVFLDLVPNWQNDVDQTRAYKTDIFTSYSGKEKRRALRQTARREWSMTALVERDRMRHVNDIMSSWTGGPVLLANPTKTQKLTGFLPAGTFITSVGAVPDWLVAGAYVCLEYRREMHYRIVKEVRGFEIEFLNADGVSWPPGTKMRPLMFGRLTTGMKQRVYTDSVLSLVLEFSVDPGSETDLEGAQRTLFDSLEVWDRPPNWRELIDVTFDATTEVLDFDRGRIRVVHPNDFSIRVQKNTYLNRNAAESSDIEGFFHRMRGQRGTFFMPTWTNDITLASGTALLDGDNLLTTEQIEIVQLLDNSPTHRRVMIRLKDGSIIYNRLDDVGAASSGYGNAWGLNYGGPDAFGEALLTFRDPWPRTIQPWEIDAISWLLPTRFASDSLTISWKTDLVSEFQTSTKTLVDLPFVPSTQYGWGFGYGVNYGGTP